MNSFIYFDHNATTAVDERVLETMLPYFNKNYGNASSITYGMGLSAKNAVETARIQVANLINCIAQEIIFTSGATEAINTAIKGIFWRYQIKGKHFITAKTEHKAVLDSLKWIETQGAEVSYLGVNENGLIKIEELENLIRKDTVAVIVMLANNETGVIQPIKEISQITNQKNTILICDATQAIGKINVDVQKYGIDVLALSAHKFYGPKGVGALYLRRKSPRVSLTPLLHGGGHERENRSGTLNVPLIVGLGKASVLATEYIQTYQEKILPIKQFLEDQLISKKIATINAYQTQRLPNTISAQLHNIKAETIIKKIQSRIGISTGSACSSSRPEPSHVLLAMGLTQEQAHHTIRISLGIDNKMEDAELFLKLINE
ncbi:MAG: cysteine desulfurase [Chitinophagales bacterium]|nr:cysteine desulfurase [Chitinophagales bacterium]MCZ2392686.1 cysteine desulfurase [Chitinophagales bacterium]